MAAIKSSIIGLCRVSVTVPDDVWDYVCARHLEQEWDRRVIEAHAGFPEANSGSNTYSEREEWCEVHAYASALMVESRLIALIREFRKRMAADPLEKDDA